MYAAFKGSGKPQYLTWMTIVAGVLSISANVTLIAMAGLAGAGYSYVITGLVIPCMLAIAWRRAMAGRSILALLRPAGLPLLVGILLSSLVLAFRGILDREYPLFVFLGAAGAVMVATAGLLIGLDYALAGRESHGVYAIGRCLSLVRKVGR
jgi:O-antigen/teichoic acid export membrane protein